MSITPNKKNSGNEYDSFPFLSYIKRVPWDANERYNRSQE